MANKWLEPIGRFIDKGWYPFTKEVGTEHILTSLDRLANHFYDMLYKYKELIIDANAVKDVAKTKYPNTSLKLLIKSKTTRHVDVGIFNQNTAQHMEDIKLESNKGIADSLYVGQVLYA